LRTVHVHVRAPHTSMYMYMGVDVSRLAETVYFQSIPSSISRSIDIDRVDLTHIGV